MTRFNGEIFATTRWTVVLAAGSRGTPQADVALEELFGEPISAKAGDSSNDLLRQRLNAASMMNDSSKRSKTLASLAIDAAKMGNAKIAAESLSQMSDAETIARTGKQIVGMLVKQGLRKEALDVANLISDSSTRDEALSEIAK